MAKKVKHEERGHAKLSASGSERWLNCPGSVKMQEMFPSTSSSFAQEGTLAHEISEQWLRNKLGVLTGKEYNKYLAKVYKHKLYYEGMIDDVEPYVNYVWEQYESAKEFDELAQLSIEEKVDWNHVYENGFGTNDAMILSGTTLEIFDLKFGRGVEVSAEHNTQGMLYGEGGRKKLELYTDIERIRIHIIQPRIGNYSVWEISAKELDAWLKDVVKPKAEAIYAGCIDTKKGAWCKFCPGKAKCKTFSDSMLEAAKAEFAEPETLSDEELEVYAEMAEDLADWAQTLKSYVLAEAMKGKKWESFKVVEGKSNRKIVDEKAAIDILIAEGYGEDDFTVKKLLGIGKLESLVGKKNYESVLGDVTIKPKGAPTLVSIDDKREDYFTKSIADDFGED